MAKFVPGRTDNQIKNRYNSNLKKRFMDKEFVQMIEAQEKSASNKDNGGSEKTSSQDEQSVDDNSVTFENGYEQ